jgi:hypothetical protein
VPVRIFMSQDEGRGGGGVLTPNPPKQPVRDRERAPVSNKYPNNATFNLLAFTLIFSPTGAEGQRGAADGRVLRSRVESNLEPGRVTLPS